MEIIEGVHRVDEASANLAHSNVYLVTNGKELTIIDTGTPGNAKKILAYIKKIGHQPSDVTTIVLTHFHMDHVGSVKDLKELLPNAKVAVHEEDAGCVSGEKQMPKPRNILVRATSAFIKIAPVQVDVVLKDKDKLGQLTVIHTPGHTPGSIALIDEARKALFVGDTLRFDGEKITGAPEQYTLDSAKAKESIEKIAMLDFDVMLPGHGEALQPNASEAVKKFSESKK